jgi:hypothetical protein
MGVWTPSQTVLVGMPAAKFHDNMLYAWSSTEMRASWIDTPFTGFFCGGGAGGAGGL